MKSRPAAPGASKNPPKNGKPVAPVGGAKKNGKPVAPVDGAPSVSRQERLKELEAIIDTGLLSMRRGRKKGTRKNSTREKATRKTLRKQEVAVVLDATPPVDIAPDVTDVTDVTAPEASQLAELFGAVRQLITRYVFLGEDEANAIALWVMMTHAVDAFHAVPYLSITSPEKRSGKTTLFEILRPLVARGYMTSRDSVVALARKINDERVTLLLDEAELSFENRSSYALGLQQVFNAGYRRNGTYSSAGTDYDVFGPKAFAANGELPDTIADRSIPNRLIRKPSTVKLERFRYHEVESKAAGLRVLLERWGEDFVTRALAKSERTAPDEPAGLDDFNSHRKADICEPLLLIAEECSPETAEAARKSLVTLCNSEEREPNLPIRALADIKAVFDAHVPSPTLFDPPGANLKERIRSTDLLTAMKNIEDAPWGRKFTTTDLASLLTKAFGPSVKPRTRRFGVTTQKGYDRSWFEPYWDSYLPKADENP